MSNKTPHDVVALETLAKLHQAYFLGLQLMVSTRKGPEVIHKWMFRLFRRQHEEKFLSSFHKLGLTDLPHAVACAQYHVLSNGVGGVPVEYMYENDRKAWVRFRYPRWMFAGPTICGVPREASLGFLEGWYAHNGVSLGNPRLGFVCVSEDMTGEFGLCGYFKEYDEPLDDGSRLLFAKQEQPPAFDATEQPRLPTDQWSAERLAKANRNYAMTYVRNGLAELASVIGHEAYEIGADAARLIGLQYYAEIAEALEIEDVGIVSAAKFLERLFLAMGNQVSVHESADGYVLEQAWGAATGALMGGEVSSEAHKVLTACWPELWVGAMSARRDRLSLDVEMSPNQWRWNLSKK